MPQIDSFTPDTIIPSYCPYCGILDDNCPCEIKHCDCVLEDIVSRIKENCVICGKKQIVKRRIYGKVDGKKSLVAIEDVPENYIQSLNRFLFRGNWCEGCNREATNEVKLSTEDTHL